jgi:SAM-dependent methyltransferase
MSEAVADVARRQCGAEVFVGDALEATFASSSFDAITCFHVLEHLHQPRQVLERVSNWLKPGGIFYAMMPNIDSAGAKIFGTYWYALELPRHVCHYSPVSLTMLARSVGLEPISVTTHRELFFESSVRYLIDALMRRAGLSRVPLAEAGQAGVPWRVVRKAFRLTLLPVFSALASLAGEGESIHAIFQKPEAAAEHSKQGASLSFVAESDSSRGQQ